MEVKRHLAELWLLSNFGLFLHFVPENRTHEKRSYRFSIPGKARRLLENLCRYEECKIRVNAAIDSGVWDWTATTYVRSNEADLDS